jgi:hypothetical protein
MPLASFCSEAVVIKNRAKLIIIAAAITVSFTFMFAWAPWLTDDYVIDKVIEKLGGPSIIFNYLGQDLAVKHVPKEVSWLPFGRYVTFPGEAGWYVSFYGSVS